MFRLNDQTARKSSKFLHQIFFEQLTSLALHAAIIKKKLYEQSNESNVKT